MTKKYEKFEEWMIDKKISVGSCEGVVLGRYFPSVVPSEVVCIKFKTGDRPTDWMWAELADVTFPEEVAPKEESSPIPWEVGQVVWDLLEGRAVVTRITNNANPVRIEFDSGEVINAYPDGSHSYGVRTIFFSEPTIIADTMPPKKPFAPKLKEGDKLMVINSHGGLECYGYVEQEFEDSVAMRTGEVYEKAYYSFFKLGEEIKWEN